jgi:hypothetical protein
MRRAMRLVGTLMAVAMVFALVVPVTGADTDKDGLWDGFEKKYGLTDPNKRDTDGDGVIDSAEDNDGDGLGNLGEQRFRTHPGKRDTDGDGRLDSKEDKDGDGRSNAREQDQRKVPTNLVPALDGHFSFPPLRFKCQSGDRQAKPVVCGFGPGGGVRVALIGDSHAMMWTSPFRKVVVNKDWRFVTMIKKACPGLLGVHPANQYRLDGGRSCLKWRRNVIARLNAAPPDLIVIASSDRYKLVSGTGKVYPKSQRPEVWKRGLKKTLAALPPESEVLILGDVPHNFGNPRKCLKTNRNDMSRCVSPKAGPAGRKIETALRTGAADNGAHFRTLYGKICSYGPCPVVQGNKLMWRDKTHVTDVFALQLAPSVRNIVEAALR